MIIIDAEGAERDLKWAKEKYHLPAISRAPKTEDHWEIVELNEITGNMGIRITTLDMHSIPVRGVDVWVSWPDGKAQLKTNPEGYVDFIMGRSAAYKPWEEEVGSISLQVWDTSDVINGLGWRGKTNHDHLNPTFQFVKAQEEPGPGEECKDCPHYREALGDILERAGTALG